jgi:hypothetical protein
MYAHSEWSAREFTSIFAQGLPLISRAVGGPSAARSIVERKIKAIPLSFSVLVPLQNISHVLL